MRAIERSILVLILVPAGTPSGAVIKFPDVPQLRDGVKVYGIEVYDVTVVLTCPNGQPGANSFDLSVLTLTLSEKSDQRHQQLPVTALAPQFTNGIWREFTPFAPDLQRCFVQFSAQATPTAFTIPVMVYYRPA